MLSMVLGLLNIGTSEMLLIVFVALLLFGGKKLPELARGLGRGIREFKDASETIKRDITEQINNFEKDIDVKSALVEDVESAIDSARKSLDEDNPETADSATKNSSAQADSDPKALFSGGAPAGTYQHNPGREPDYYGSQDVYYNESGTESNSSPQSDTNQETEAPSDSHPSDPSTNSQ